MATNNNWNNAIAAANSAITLNSGTNTVSVSTDASATTVNIATGGAVKTTTLGSTNSTSTTTVQSGSGALNITATNGAITMNSGTGTVGIGTDATAATYNFATGAGAKVVTLGTTTTTSSLALKYGTADFSLASATGTIMSALDTGEITYPLQSAFLAFNSATDTNQTGNGTLVTVDFDTEIFDQNGDFSADTFTAPVTARYELSTQVQIGSITALMTLVNTYILTSNRNYYFGNSSPGANRDSGDKNTFPGSVIADMDAADTAIVKAIITGGAGNTASIVGDGTVLYTFFSGYLSC